jgi:Domain of unknown function (DUF4412)
MFTTSKAIAAGLLFFTALAQGDVVLVQRVEGGKQSGTVTLKVKEARTRVDVTPQMSILTDGGTGEVVTLMHAEKCYMKIPMAQTEALMERMHKLQPPLATPPKLTATGKREKIDQYECEIFTWSTPAVQASYWVAKDFPDFAKYRAVLEKSAAAGLSALTKELTPKPGDIPGMVIKSEVSMVGQKVVTTLVSASEETLDGALFSIPEGYKESPSPSFGFPKGK